MVVVCTVVTAFSGKLSDCGFGLQLCFPPKRKAFNGENCIHFHHNQQWGNYVLVCTRLMLESQTETCSVIATIISFTHYVISVVLLYADQTKVCCVTLQNPRMSLQELVSRYSYCTWVCNATRHVASKKNRNSQMNWPQFRRLGSVFSPRSIEFSTGWQCKILKRLTRTWFSPRFSMLSFYHCPPDVCANPDQTTHYYTLDLLSLGLPLSPITCLVKKVQKMQLFLYQAVETVGLWGVEAPHFL